MLKVLFYTNSLLEIGLGFGFQIFRYNFLQLIMKSKSEGKQRVGQRKKSWMRNSCQWTSFVSVEDLLRFAKDRNRDAKLLSNLSSKKQFSLYASDFCEYMK